MSAASRQPGRGLAGEPPQGIAGLAWREAAFHQCLRAGRGKTGLVGLVGQQRFIFAAAFLLKANHFLILGAGLIDRVAAEKMEIE